MKYRDYEDDYNTLDCFYMNYDPYYDPHDTIMLFYDVEANSFIDTFGNVQHDIYRLLKPWQIFLFKYYEEDQVFPDVTNTFLVELVYPDYMYLRHS